MTLTEKVKEAARIAVIGSIGFGAGAITFAPDGIVDMVQEYRKEAELERAERQLYEQRMKQYVPPPIYEAPVRYDVGFHCIRTSCAM